MLPGHPPSGPEVLLASSAPTLSALAKDLTLGAYFLVAEALVVFSTWSAAALEHYSRSRLLEIARARGIEERIEARLEHTGSYELTVRLTRFLGTALLVVGIAYVALYETVAGPRGGFPWSGVVVAAAIAFFVIFFVNDVLVRLAARRRPSRFLLDAMPLLEAFRRLTAPLRLPLVLLARLVFRVELESPEQTAREEVLESVEEGEREGSLSADEADMIESIMDLDTVTAEDICTPRGELAMVHEGIRLEEAARFMIDEGHRRIPVYGKDRDDVIGVIYAFDLLAQVARGRALQSVREVMRSPFFVPEGKPLNDLLSEMRARRVSLAVVLNEFGATSGVVTIEDVLEEIVGEIEDEHDKPPPPVVVRNGILVVDGRTPIEDVNAALAVALPVEEDFETVGGLVFHRLGKVPRAGDELTVDGVTLTVTDADERTVRRLRVTVARDEE